jgi:hypothetical protein
MTMWPQLSLSIDKVFCSIDTDGNGFIDCNELKAGFASMVCTFSSLSHYPRFSTARSMLCF